MKKFISCGKFNKYFYYIILAFFFELINDTLYGFNYLDIFREVKIIDTKTQAYFSWHHIIHQIFNYFGTTIIAIFLKKYETNINQRPSNASNKTHDTNSKQIVLIHNDSEDFNQTNKYLIIFLIIIVIWIFEELLIDIYTYALKDLDFWMVELVIITKINSLMFNLKIYAHQRFALWSIILPCLLKIVIIILSYFDDNDEEIPILYNINKIYIPIGIVIYIVLITLRSYVNAKIKWFMDLKYISHSNLLFYYGILGTIICSIIASISTFTKCKHKPYKLDIYDYICKIPYYEPGEDTPKEKYLESFIYYYKTFKGKINKEYSPIEILYEIIIIISGMLTFFFQKYFAILVIKYLTPVHLIFSIPFFFILQKIVLIIYNYIIGELYIHSKIKFILLKFILDISGDLFSIFGFLIYLEIIELNFGKYNYDTKKNIIKRSFDESYGINDNKKYPIINNEEEEEEEEDDQEEEESDYDLTLN